MRKKVVVFGGGTGITYILQGLKLFPVDITAIITVSDNGYSTGKLREEFNMPAVGDLRKVIVSLSDADEKIKDLLQYRFNTYSDLNGHPIGNLIMVGMYNMNGSLKESIYALSTLLNVKDKVLPLSEDNLTLFGETYDGEIIEGEKNIPSIGKRYKRLFYQKEPLILKEVIEEVEDADLIIFSLGSLFTSVLPHIISKKVVKAIDNSKAKIMYTCNAVSQPGETDNYTVSDHIKTINEYLNNKKIDVVLAANTKMPAKIVEKYATTEQKDLVIIDKNEIEELNCELIESDMLIIENSMIRHNSLKIANEIFNYLMR